MTKLSTLVLLSLLLCLYSSPLISQDIVLKGITVPQLKSNQTKLEDRFSEYLLFQYESPQSLKTIIDNGQIEINIQIPKYINAVLSLTERDLLSETYHSSLLTNGKQASTPPLLRTYQGNILGDVSSEVRVSISDGALYGYISSSDQKLWIESATTFDNSLSANIMVAHLEKDIKSSGHQKCASHEVQERISKLGSQTKMADACQEVELAIAMDHSYITNPAHNSVALATAKTIHIMNLVEGSFMNQFEAEIQFKIVEHFAPNSAAHSNALWGAGSYIYQLLINFTNWGPSGFTQGHDIGQLWSSKALYGLIDRAAAIGDIPSNRNINIAGLAWINAVCSNSRYQVLESFSNDDSQLRILTAHELGHNFGASHDPQGSTFIMSPTILPSITDWSATSISVINNAVNGYTCLESCIPSSCSQITDVRVYGCNTGPTPTYQLDITITHNGGGTSTGFSVMIDGSSYPYDWEQSPQVVSICNLIADGGIDKQITIAASDGSDIGCGGAANYSAPDGNCALTISEAFNDCNIPSEWSSLTTNNISVPSYSWRIGDASRSINNYDNSQNATSSKTIDGSCMAYMDDDLYHPWSGIATLVTETIDASEYESLSLSIDYIFNKFDAPKDPNDSYFKIDVWDGTQYVNLITDTDDSCPWYNVWQPQCITSIDIDISEMLSDSLHIAFIYTDMNSNAGMAAIDNFELVGQLKTQSSACPTVLTMNTGISSGSLIAKEKIITFGPVNISGPTTLSTPQMVFSENFEVPSNVELTVMNDGCDNSSN